MELWLLSGNFRKLRRCWRQSQTHGTGIDLCYKLETTRYLSTVHRFLSPPTYQKTALGLYAQGRPCSMSADFGVMPYRWSVGTADDHFDRKHRQWSTLGAIAVQTSATLLSLCSYAARVCCWTMPLSILCSRQFTQPFLDRPHERLCCCDHVGSMNGFTLFSLIKVLRKYTQACLPCLTEGFWTNCDNAYKPSSLRLIIMPSVMIAIEALVISTLLLCIWCQALVHDLLDRVHLIQCSWHNAITSAWCHMSALKPTACYCSIFFDVLFPRISDAFWFMDMGNSLPYVWTSSEKWVAK